jgi:hypothetical protein
MNAHITEVCSEPRLKKRAYGTRKRFSPTPYRVDLSFEASVYSRSLLGRFPPLQLLLTLLAGKRLALTIPALAPRTHALDAVGLAFADQICMGSGGRGHPHNGIGHAVGLTLVLIVWFADRQLGLNCAPLEQPLELLVAEMPVSLGTVSRGGQPVPVARVPRPLPVVAFPLTGFSSKHHRKAR